MQMITSYSIRDPVFGQPAFLKNSRTFIGNNKPLGYTAPPVCIGRKFHADV